MGFTHEEACGLVRLQPQLLAIKPRHLRLCHDEIQATTPHPPPPPMQVSWLFGLLLQPYRFEYLHHAIFSKAVVL